MNELWLIGVVGGGAGAVVGAPMVFRGRTDRQPWAPDQIGGLWLLMSAAALLFSGLRHGGAFSPAMDLGVEIATDAMALAGWTMLLLIARRLAGIEGGWLTRPADHAVLPAAYLVLVAAAGFPDVPFLWIMPVFAPIVVGIGIVWARTRLQAPSPAARQVAVVFAFSVVLFCAQLVRSLFPQVLSLREIVPTVITLSYFGLAFAIVGRRLPSRRAAYSKSGLTEHRGEALVSRLDAGMEAHAWYRDPAASPASLAALLGVTPQWLSQALNQRRRQTFAEYVTAWRLREARALLLDPANDVYTIEGLARQAGFSSRSSFYKAFREREGGTPAELRVRQTYEP